MCCQDKAKVGGVFDTIFKQIDKYLPLAVGSYQAFQKPPTQGQAKGLAAIQSAGQQVIAALNQIAQIRPLTPELISQAQAIAGTLDSSQYFYQAKSGKDAQALNDFKIQAQNIVSSMTQPVITTNNAGGLSVVNTPNNAPNNAPVSDQIVSGVDNKTLAYGVLGLFGYFLLIKK